MTVLVEVTVSLLIEVDTLISVVVTGEVGGEREDLNQDSEKNIISNHSRDSGGGAQNL